MARFHDQNISQTGFMAGGNFAPPRENTGTKKSWWNLVKTPLIARIILHILKNALKMGFEKIVMILYNLC